MLTDHNKGKTEMEVIKETTYTVWGVYITGSYSKLRSIGWVCGYHNGQQYTAELMAWVAEHQVGALLKDLNNPLADAVYNAAPKGVPLGDVAEEVRKILNARAKVRKEMQERTRHSHNAGVEEIQNEKE